MTSSGPWDMGNSPGDGRCSVNPVGSQPKFTGSTSGLKLDGASAGCPGVEAAVDVTGACRGADGEAGEAGEAEELCRAALRPTPAPATSTTEAAASTGISHDRPDRSMCGTVTRSADSSTGGSGTDRLSSSDSRCSSVVIATCLPS